MRTLPASGLFPEELEDEDEEPEEALSEADEGDLDSVSNGPAGLASTSWVLEWSDPLPMDSTAAVDSMVCLSVLPDECSSSFAMPTLGSGV